MNYEIKPWYIKYSLCQFYQNMKINDIYVIIAGRVLQALLSIATLRAITTFFEKNDIADYYIVYSVIFFYSYVVIGGFSSYFNRHLLEGEFHPHAQFIRYVRQVFFLGFIGIPINYFILGFLVNFEAEKSFVLIFIIFANVTFSAILRNLLTSINIFQNIKFFVLFNLLSLFFGMIFALVFTFNLGSSIENWFIGIIIGEWLILPIVYLRFKKLCGVKLNLSKRSYLPLTSAAILKFCGPLVLTNLLIWIQMHAYRIIVDKKVGSELLSDLAVAIGIALAIYSMLETVINQYFYPKLLKGIIDKPKSERVSVWLIIFTKSIFLYFNLTVFVICNSQSLLIFLTDKKFHDVYILTSFAAIMELGRVINNLFLLLYQSEKRTELTILPYLIGAITLIFCLLVFETQATIFYVILSLILSHWAVTCFLIIKSKIIFDIKFTFILRYFQKNSLITLPLFLILMYASHLSYSFSYHVAILILSFILLGYSVYPYLKDKK